VKKVFMFDSKKSPRIEVTKDGPYIVEGNVPLNQENIVIGGDGEPICWEKGPSFTHGETYSLCRCGASRTKPFCGGTHVSIKFRSDT
jgi:CDGSH-type Zn-finger protein